MLLTSIVPRRVTGSGFEETRYVKVPSPCPFVADVIVIQLGAFDAAHVQSRDAAIATVPAPPAAASRASPASSATPIRDAVASRAIRNRQSESVLIRCTRAQLVQVAYLSDPLPVVRLFLPNFAGLALHYPS